SKAEGRLIDLNSIVASPKAIEIAAQSDKDPRVVELILEESDEVLRVRPGAIIVGHRLGFVAANAGIDQSNIGNGPEDDRVLLLPLDPDGTCNRLRGELKAQTGADVVVMIIDSIGRAWRNGTVGTAIGLSGMGGPLEVRPQTPLVRPPPQNSEA